MPNKSTDKLRALAGGDPAYRRKALAERDETIISHMRTRQDWTAQEIQKEFGMSRCMVEKMLARNATIIVPSSKRPTEGGGTRPHKTYKVKKVALGG